MKRRGLRIMVAAPTHDMMPAATAYDLAQMMAYTSVDFVGPGRPIDGLQLAFSTGTYVHKGRHDLAMMALKNEADYILWFDTDMRFPKDALMRLLVHNEDMVGINYSNRRVPPDFVAIKRRYPGEKLVTDEESTGLEEVEAIGFGLFLMKTRVLRTLPHPDRLGTPWFWFGVTEHNTMVGEDVYFCEIAREAGFKVMVDHDLSKECAHIGSFDYTLDHPLAMREEQQAEAV